MKVWLACFRILASDTAYFICFFIISVFFLRAFKAYCLPVPTCFARNTLPKLPDPKTLIISNEEKLTFCSVILLS